MASHETPFLIWEVISYHKYSETSYQPSPKYDFISVTCRGTFIPNLSVFTCHFFSFSFFEFALSLMSKNKRVRKRTTQLPVYLPVSSEPRQSSAIYHRRFLEHLVTNTFTRTTCSTSQRNTGKVMEQSSHGWQSKS